jgi:hypothetical protein
MTAKHPPYIVRSGQVRSRKFIENTLKIDYNGKNFNIFEKGNNFYLCRKNFNDSSFSRGTLSKCRLYKI